MLILNRKSGQSIISSNEIKFFILTGISDIRIGIEAPKDMQILRGEILHRYRPHLKPYQPIITYTSK